MRTFLILLMLGAAVWAQRVTLTGKTGMSGPVQFGIAPPLYTVTAHHLITFNTNSTGDSFTTNAIIATSTGTLFTSWTNAGGGTGFYITNTGRAALNAIGVNGAVVQPSGGNGIAYNHSTNPAQWSQGTLAVDDASISASALIYLPWDGAGGASSTYDQLQWNSVDGSTWCSCNVRNGNPMKIVAHSDGIPGAGAEIGVYPGWYHITVAVSNQVCTVTVYDASSWALVGSSSYGMGSPSPMRYLVFGQYQHPSISGYTSVFDTILVNTNGLSPLGP